jgi:lipopolysaccharide biosynthesis protein
MRSPWRLPDGTVLRESLPHTTIVRRPSPGTDSRRFAIVASFGKRTVPAVGIVKLTDELVRCGFAVVVVRSSADNTPWADLSALDPAVGYVQRPNVGYDFGSWAAGMASFPSDLRRDQVLLVNDSIAGPFAPLDALLEDFSSTSADVWAATSTLQFGPHLQSFMVGYRRGVLREAPLRDFWRGLEPQSSKHRIVEAHEIGLSQIFQSEGFSATAAIPSEVVVRDGDNPTIVGWRGLLDAGFPFVKRELLVKKRFAAERNEVREYVRALHGVDPMDWIEQEVVNE